MTTETTQNGGGAGTFARIGLTPRECKYARARARGWNDVRDGKGFRPEYDRWDRKRQYAYERGRFQATIALQSLISGRQRLSVWKRDETLWGPLTRSCGPLRASKIELETRVARRAKGH